MGYCHCDACRRYSGMPVNSFTLWKPEQVNITKGPDLLTGFQSSEMKDGLPKLRDFPVEIGGSGETMAEKQIATVSASSLCHPERRRRISSRNSR
jgi:hypothetical protein